MRPNTPHFVVTPDSAICHGGHFYAMSTIRDTIFGIYHMFVASKNITNTEHTKDAHLLFRRLVIYCHYILIQNQDKQGLPESLKAHVPDVSTFEGVLDLFMLCIVMELGDLVNPLAYQKKHQRDHDCDHNHLCTIHACGLARNICRWWRINYMFFDPTDNTGIDGDIIFEDLFCQHVNTLVVYKRLAEAKDIHGDVLECTAEVLESLVKKYFPAAFGLFGASQHGFE